MLGFPGSSAGKESTCNAGDLDFIPGSGRSPTEETDYPLQYSWASLMAQTVKNPPAKWETWVWSLSWEDSLEEGTATHSSVLAWRIPWILQRSLEGYSPWGCRESDTTEWLSTAQCVYVNLQFPILSPFTLAKAVVFPVVVYGYESWTIKKAKCRRIDAFELWCWRRLLRVPWAARRSNQSILKEISPGCSLEGLMLKLKIQYFGHWCKELTHWKRPWCWERLKAGGEGDDRGWEGRMAPPTQWTWVWVNPRSWWWTGRPGVLQSMGSQRARHDWATELNWTDLIPGSHNFVLYICDSCFENKFISYHFFRFCI